MICSKTELACQEHVDTQQRVGHLDLQALDLFLALTDLRGKPGGHALSYNLQVPLPLKLILEVVNLLLSIGALLAS